MSEANQKDLVLSINEYAYVLDETKGFVSCLVGPIKMSLSQSDKLVNFNSVTKRFEPCGYRDAVNLFKTAPENWYCILKNPTKNGRYPAHGTSNNLPDDMQTGRKVNIRGPVSFALYPGQMAKVVKGHSLRSNEYLLARVYEAEAANSSEGDIRDAEGNAVEDNKAYVNGQLLVIKGTEVSFYIPPTGIEVIPLDNGNYVRDAVTLERLEYCILKDEDGNKRYVHGPEVVFPKPTETFVTSSKGGFIFKAIELSKISGVYVKVIAEYKEGNTTHEVGEELFITGNEQMIYYPRPEHAIISYDNKIVHHATAIPEGEGRYIMNRLTGEIKTVHGPAMYLPDPRTEVVVKRKLTTRECQLLYPNNQEVLGYNAALTERAVEKAAKNINLDMPISYASAGSDSLAMLEAKATISRGTSYTKPRTITLDNKFDGVVAVDVWNGYAVNVVSKNGTRKVVCGPQTILLDYDQTLEEIRLSTGIPKTHHNLASMAFLQVEGNKIVDVISAETKDFVPCDIKLSYLVNFLKEYQDKWFNTKNYVQVLCDTIRAKVKKEVKKYPIEEFYANYQDILREVIFSGSDTYLFEDNGSAIVDYEIMSFQILDGEIEEQMREHQNDMITKSLEKTAAEAQIGITEQLALVEQKEQELRTQKILNQLTLQKEEAVKKAEAQAEVNRLKEAEQLASQKAEQDMQVIIDAIHAAKLEREQKENAQIIEHQRQLAAIQEAKEKAYAETVAKIMESVSPDLIAAMNSTSNSELISALSTSVAPYAIAQDESVSTVVNKLVRGLPVEDILKNTSIQ